MSGLRQVKEEKAHDVLSGGGKLFMLAQLATKWQPMAGRKRKEGVGSERMLGNGDLDCWAKNWRAGGRH